MGLDMYAYKTTQAIDDTGFEVPDDAVEIGRWRKHPNLHGWMEELYYGKGGCKTFNCEAVRLDPDDLDLLEAAVNENLLPETTGFFFGVSQPEDKASDLAFIKKAREALNSGYRVFYTSWW